MSASMITISFQGLETTAIDVQVQILPGLPAFVLVGLPDKAVNESRERVRAALYSLGIALPPKKIVVNLAPADIQKEGSHYDLPIALTLMRSLGVVPWDVLEAYVALGELSLNGGGRYRRFVCCALCVEFEKRAHLSCRFRWGGRMGRRCIDPCAPKSLGPRQSF